MAAAVSYTYANLLCIFLCLMSFALEQTNLGDLCLRPKQIEILLNVWNGKDVTADFYCNKFSLLDIKVWCFISFWIFPQTRSRTRAGRELEIQPHPLTWQLTWIQIHRQIPLARTQQRKLS